MKIISKYKDYYDAMAYMYGGGDEKIVYNRADLMHKEQVTPGHWVYPDFEITGVGASVPTPSVYDRVKGWRSSGRDFCILSICGRGYSLIPVNEPGQPRRRAVYDPSKHQPLLARFGWSANIYWWEKKRENGLRPDPQAVQHSGLIDISRQTGQPVFIVHAGPYVNHKPTYRVEGHYTPLTELGVAGFYPADQIYQDLSYFISNQMKDSPDLQPAGKPAQTDIEKIEAHGFDKKQSFRHRK